MTYSSFRLVASTSHAGLVAVSVFLLSVALTAAGSAPLGAESYDLRGPGAVVGRTVQEQSEVRIGEAEFRMEGEVQGQAQQMIGSFFSQQHGTERSTVLAVEEGVATRVEVVIERQEGQTRMEMAGQQMNNPQTSPLVGETVVLERQGDAWRATLKNGEPTPQQLSDLEEMSYPDDSEMFAASVAVGESWSVSGDRLSQLVNLGPTESLDGTATGTLREVREDGKVAIIDWQLSLNMSVRDAQGLLLQVEISATGETERDLVAYVDTEFRLEGTVAMRGQQGPMAMVIEGPLAVLSRKAVL